MKVQRCERIVIKKDHPKYKIIDEMCFKSKELYNYANYIIRQEFINNNKYISYYDMNKELKTHQQYKDCGSQPANCTLRLLDKNWKSFFKAIKDWKKNSNKYLGRPKLPNYLPKNGRFNWMIPNNQVYYKPEDDEIYFQIRKLQGYKWFSRCLGRLIQVRFVPKNGNFIMEIIYEIEVDNVEEKVTYDRCIAIDLGVDNLMTVTNNIGLSPYIINGRPIKSINQYYNKKLADLKSELKKRNGVDWSKKCDQLTFKRSNRIADYLHKATSYIINWCIENNIKIIIVGLNKEWKQKANMGKKNNQNFVSIPYNDLLIKLKYKCENNGFQFIQVEESYTSGTSYLDDELPNKKNYNKERRIQRGLFQASNMLINADVNGSLQIMKKVFPDSYTGYGIEVDLTPCIVNLSA